MSFDFISALYDEPPPLRGNAPSTAHSNNHDVFVDEIMRASDSTTASTNMEYMQRFERNRDNLDFFREELESELRSELRDQLRRRSTEFSENSSRHLNSSNLNLNPNLNNSNNLNDSDNQSNDTVQGAVPAPVPSRRDAAASPGFDGSGASRGLSDIVGVLPRCDQCRGSASDSEGDVRSNPTPNSGFGRNDDGGNNHNSLTGTDRRRSGNGDDGSSPSAAAGTSAGGTPDNHVAVAQPPSMSASALAATSAEELNIQLTRWLNEAVPLAGPVATAPTAASVTAWTPAHSSPATQRGNDDDDDADTSTFGSLLPNALVTSASNRAVALDALRTADPIELIRLDADLNAALFNDWSALPSLNALSSALSLDPVTHDRNSAGASLPLHHGVGRINGIGSRNRGVDIVSSQRFDALRLGGANFSELQNGATLPRDNTAVVGGLAVAGANDQILYANNDSSDNNEFIISDNRHSDGNNSINLPSVSLSRLPRGPTNLTGLLTAGNSLARLSNQDGLVDSQPPTSVAASASTSTWGNNIDNDGSGNNWVPVAGSSASNNNGGNTITSLTSLYDSTSVQSATDILRRLLSQHESSRGLPAPQRPLVRASNDTSSGSSISCSNNSDNRSCSGGSSSSSSRGHSDNSNQPRGQFSSSSSSSGDNENNNGRSDWIAQSMPFDDDIESIGTVDQDSGADEIAADDGLNTSIVANTFESTSSFDVGAFSAPTASSSTSASNTNSAAAATASSIATATTPTSSLESTATTSVAQPQGHRVRRQAAIRGMERISTALATHGMGPVDKSINMDHKPIATKKRSTSQGHANDSKKRSIVEVDDDLNTKQPAIKMEKSIPAAAKEPKQEDEASPTCCICLEEPTYEELASINVCKHPFCFSCIEKWADRENTCPLCKTRFVKIERVNKPKRKRKGADSDGVTQEKPRNVKRVRQRDQRHDYSFSNPLQGIFASMEANGTWPTHIAQLLFSGLGANTMRGRERGRAAIRPFGVAAATSTGPPVSSAATDSLTSHRERSGMAPPPVRLSTRYNRSVPRATSSAASESSRAGTNSSSAHAMGSILNRVSVSRHDSYEIGGGATSSAFGAPRYSSSRPHHSSSTASSTHASFDRTPWSAHASISVTYGPDGFVGRTSSPDSRLSGFGGHGRPASASTTGNSTGGLNHFNIDEEQDLLSSLSPSSYIRRIHRQMERSNRGNSNNSYSGQHHFSTVSSPDSSARFAQSNASTSAAVPTASSLRGSTSSRHDPWEQYFRTSSLSNYLPTPIGPDIESDNRRAAGLRTTASNAAGSTAETALEIDDDSDDDDVVEVLEIAANV